MIIVTDDPTMACGISSGCINRELSMECPKECVSGDSCQNQKFQRKQYAHVQICKTKKKGFGLQTLQRLVKGTFIIEYCGEVLSSTVFEKRIQEHAQKGAKHFYFMSLKPNEVLYFC